ncbi:MAG: hypothetical protein GC152_02875 [Alphaproteobacteria bacterium]|nr:hypothetical protein [Alphaproteobacteria bacterium]
MVFLISRHRRRRLIDAAAAARDHRAGVGAAIALVVFYNFVGVTDVFSTWLALSRGLGEEANPILRAMMEAFGPGWIAGKFALQAIVSGMVLWFPHPIVCGLFGAAVAANAVIVANNFLIAYGLN